MTQCGTLQVHRMSAFMNVGLNVAEILKRKRYFSSQTMRAHSWCCDIEPEENLLPGHVNQKKKMCLIGNFVIKFAYKFPFTSIYVEEAF